jgi:hypothetical protein
MSLLTDSLKMAHAEIDAMKEQLEKMQKQYQEAVAMMADLELRAKQHTKKEKANGK